MTEANENAMCIKLEPSDFQTMIKTLELPQLSKKGGKNIGNCRYMMIVMKD